MAGRPTPPRPTPARKSASASAGRPVPKSTAKSTVKQTAVSNMKHGSTRAAQRDPSGPAWTPTDERLERESAAARQKPSGISSHSDYRPSKGPR